LWATHRPSTARLHEPAPPMTSPTRPTCSVKCRRSPCSTRYSPWSCVLVRWLSFEQSCLENVKNCKQSGHGINELVRCFLLISSFHCVTLASFA
jgi:hypothetical protein